MFSRCKDAELLDTELLDTEERGREYRLLVLPPLI